MKKPTVAKLKKEADRVHSIYIRMKFADHAGYVTCVTCGIVKPWKEMQCGHYLSRRFNITRYLEENTHPQCIGCNCFHHGEMDRYALYMIEMYGKEFLDELDEMRKETKQFTISDLQEIIADRKQKIYYDYLPNPADLKCKGNETVPSFTATKKISVMRKVCEKCGMIIRITQDKTKKLCTHCYKYETLSN